MARYLILCVILLGANSCASMMQNTSQAVQPETALVDVWYATDRKTTDEEKPKDYFGVERGKLTYGIYQVAINLDKSILPTSDQSLWQLESGDKPSDAAELRNISPLEQSEFFTRMQQALNSSEDKSILLYIHGYLRSFEAAALEAARLAYEISYKGVPAMYSWPSRDSLVNYIADVAGIDWSTANLRGFLEDLTRKTQGATIHVVAHSLGNRGLFAALLELQKEGQQNNLPWKFGEIVLVAPDYDRDTFKRDVAPELVQSKSRITLYVSGVDVPLFASKMLSAYPRLGDGSDVPTIIPGIETIDATEAVGWTSGHTYHRRNVQVLQDLKLLINNQLGAAERSTVESVDSPEGRYWKLPEPPPDQ